MKNRTCLPWVAAAVLALAVPFTPSVQAASHTSDSKVIRMLSADLPPGVTLKSASIDQLSDAIYTATSQRPDLATSILQAALKAKHWSPERGELPCTDVMKLLRKSVAAAPDKARDLIETAISLDPECTDALNGLLADPTLLGLNPGAFGAGLNNSGFGAGLGGSFPGSPGFVGSPPSGAVALPPAVGTPTTSVTNG